jgi:hypothetical protein
MQTKTKHTETAILSPEEETRRGTLIREVLKLRRVRGTDRINTTWGTKSDIGLFRTVERLVLDGE